MLNPGTTLAIILGVSECPRAPQLQPLPQCANSARDFELYLLSTLGVPRSNIINLFNSEAAASDQLDVLEDWLSQTVAKSLKPTDLFVFYTGHGGFTRNDQAYFLAVQKTRAGSEGATSIRYIDLASSIRRHADSLRKYLVLDCCFAASAVVKMQSDLSQMVVQRVEDELPPSGTAVLCSSSAKLVSIAPAGERHTMFSGAFLQCLIEGIPGGGRALTLEDVGKRTREIIHQRFPNDSVRPELHVPEQSKGNPARVPIFPNVRWVEPEPLGQTLDELPVAEAAKAPSPGNQIAAKAFAWPAEVWIGSCSGLAAALLMQLLPFPFGLNGTPYSVIPPIAPALCLMAGLIGSARSAQRKRSLVLATKVSIAVFPAWFIAWNIVYFAALTPALSFSVTGIPSAGIAGFLAALLMNLSAQSFSGGFRSLNRRRLKQLSISALPLGLLGILTMSATDVWGQILNFPFDLALFVPWHTFCIAMYEWKIDNTGFIEGVEIVTPFRKNFLLAISIAAIFVVGAFLIPRGLKQLLSDVPMTFYVDEATREQKGNQTQLTVNYQIASTTSDLLTCKLRLRIDDKDHDSNESPDQIYKGINRVSATFSLSGQPSFEAAQVRLACSAPWTSYETDWQDISVN